MLPDGADRLRFKLNVTDVTSDGDVLLVFWNEDKRLLSTVPLGAPAIDIGQLTQGFEERELLIPETIRQAMTKNHGEVVTLTFQLVDTVQGRPIDSIVYLDDIRVGNAGQAIQAETVPSDVIEAVHLTKQADLDALIDAAQAGWTDLINTPNWGGWITPWEVGSAATEFSAVQVNNVQEYGDARIGEGRFDNQFLFPDSDRSLDSLAVSYESTGSMRISSLRNGLSNSTFEADQIGSDGHPSLATNSHAVQAQDDSLLFQGHDAILGHTVVDEHATSHANIGDCGATIDWPIIPGSIADFNVRRDFSSPGSEGAIADINIFQLEEFTLPLLPSTQFLSREFDGFVEPRFFTSVATGLDQDENQQNQSPLQHSPSFGTPTLPPDRKLGNEVVQTAQGLMVRCGAPALSVVGGPALSAVEGSNVYLVCLVCLVRGRHSSMVKRQPVMEGLS